MNLRLTSTQVDFKQLVLLLLFLGISNFTVFSQAPTPGSTPSTQKQYSYKVNLKDCKKDRLLVELEVPLLPDKELWFRFPKTVPGIYAELNFGKAVDSLWALDEKGKKVNVIRSDSNSWKMSNAIPVKRILYRVNDNWDDFTSYNRGIYKSPGSTFNASDNFLINNNSIFGYFEGYDKIPIIVSYEKLPIHYAATSLTKKEETSSRVIFRATDYHQLVDSPILFSKPDTTTIWLGSTKIMIACYSTTGEKISKNIATHITPTLAYQKAYLGGALPVKDYTFILYHQGTKDSSSLMSDGLEHGQSTVILFNMVLVKEALNRIVNSMASHEFFHTVIPLALHSEEIENYSFNDVKLSKHLWLYEGMTEYFTIHAPVIQKAEGLLEFTQKLDGKINGMKSFIDTIALTDLSLSSFTRQDQYLNIYEKGALACLCMDIRLRELSAGKYGVQNLVQDLMGVYGKNKPFKDNELFDKIVQLSGQKEIRDFIQRYLEGKESLPLKEYFEKVGFKFGENGRIEPVEKPTPEQLTLRNAWVGV